MFFSLVRVITPVLYVLVQVNCQMFFDNVKVEVLAISEMELSKEFTSKEEIEIFFCDLFRKVQKVFDTIPGLNITIELSGVSVNWRANKQNYLEKNKWTYENETFIKPVALISLLEYANIKRSWDVYDAAILFTRIPCANPNGQNGEPQFVPGRNLSVRSYFFAPTGCEYKPSMAIMYPNPRGVAYELAYLLGAFEQGVILKKPSWFENCKENSIPRNGYVKSDPNGPFSKCAILGIKNYLREYGTCFFENNHPAPLQCSKYKSS